MNKLSRFWQELKRRKVVRVITVYAAAAFVILELTDIVAPSLGLPDWTLNLVIILLVIGFIIAAILSWIYDIKPEGGFERTTPAQKVSEENKSLTSNRWKIASYFSFVVIFGLIVFNIMTRNNPSDEREILDKSIAVLPFINDSPDEENEYFINGTMEAIIDNLCKIEDLRVVGRTSVEQYRNAPKPIRVIADEMDVSYILEGSGQKYGNKVRLTLQLLDARNDQHLWSSPFSREILIEDIFNLQSEIAELVATEIEAIITPEEKQLIERIPTTNLTAYDFYQRGLDEHYKYWLDFDNKEALERAETLYLEALDFDSAFALAYSGLAWIYFDKHNRETFLAEDFLDSMLILANISLSIDDQLAEAYQVRGDYYRFNYKRKLAINEYDKAIKFTPNDYWAYFGRGLLYSYDDLVKTIDNFQKAASLHRGPYLPVIYRNLGLTYNRAGIKENAIYYVNEALKLDDDSAKYYSSLAEIEDSNGNFEKAIKLWEKSYAIDSTDSWVIYRTGQDYIFVDQLKESLESFIKYEKRVKTLDRLIPTGHSFRIGYAYWVNGFKEEAEYYFIEGLRFHNEMIELDRHYLADYITFYNLAAIHSFLGDKDKAYENLRLMDQRPRMPKWMIKELKTDPLFDSIRDEPEFQQIVRDVEVKYKAEHERVRQWLEENKVL